MPTDLTRALTGALLLVFAHAHAHVASAGQRTALAVVSAGPAGALNDLAQANEIRVTFSEPMVTLGRIPEPVTAPFFRIRPEVRGTFRWSGTTMLVFTPDPGRKLPFATTYEVTIEAGAAAVSGRRLDTPYRFQFTTPTVQLLSTAWARRTGRHDSPVQIYLRFNQPIDPSAMRPHVSAAFEPHVFEPPALPSRGAERLKRTDPEGLQRFHDKVAAVRAAAQSDRAVPLAPASTWDRKRFPPSPDLLVLDTAGAPPPESWIRVTIGPNAPSAQGSAVPGTEQHFTIQVERAFFADGFQCQTACDPSDYNPMRLRAAVHVDAWQKAVTVRDVTSPSAEAPVNPAAGGRRESPFDNGAFLSLEDAGYERQPPVRTWLVRVDPTLTAEDGQTLGYPWVGAVENWHERAFTSFGDGHGVWETSGGPVLPFYARNFVDVTQWMEPLAVGELMPTINRLRGKRFRMVPPGPGEARRLGGSPDRVLSHGLDLSAALGARKTGLVWTGIREGRPIARSRPWAAAAEKSSIVQVTNLGITVKDSPYNTLVFVTRLDTGAPVDAARVSIVTADEKVFWRGTTGPDGVAVAPGTRIRHPQRWWEFSFAVIAEKDGDVAYTGGDWTEGVSPWEFGLRYDPTEAEPVLRGTVFSDRGVYRLGEEVHFKAILRRDTARGIRLLDAGTTVHVTVSDGEGREVDRRAVTVNDWSSAEWTLTLPARGALGAYSVSASLREPPEPGQPAEDPLVAPGERGDPWERRWDAISGTFLVAAYRRPEFRVDVTFGGEPPMAGAALSGVISARYLFGAPMGGRPVAYKIFRERVHAIPPAILEKYPAGDYAFGDCCEPKRDDVAAEELALDASGELNVDHVTPRDLEHPYRYTLEGDVEDVSRQHIAGRASVVVHPAPWYVGIERPPYFVDQSRGLSTAIVAVTPAGETAAGVAVRVTLTRTQWHSVRRAEGNGFYTWETTRKDIEAGSWTVTTAAEPVALEAPLPAGGSYTLTARATDPEGRSTVTSVSFYVLGEGYTAWARYDHNRIDLVPERSSYRPGETARIMVQSPWETATALVTTEREGIRSHRQIALASTQQTISVPISEADIPNLYVSVLLVKGRTAADGGADGGDPGKPAFRLGYVELKVEDASRRLDVRVSANREEYRPGSPASVDVIVTDAAGKPAASEVTLWAVDYGVLSLTAFRTPDVLSSVYVQKALQVMTADGRQRIVSRRVLTPKGDTDGGGGGRETGASEIRRDFRVLAFWLGSVKTDAAGRAAARLTLPQSLTTYRIMAVAADRESRFGSGESEIRINKPVLLRAAFPRFLAVGDSARFGSVVTNQLAAGGKAIVTVESLDPGILAFRGSRRQTIEIAGGGTQEVRFDAVARAAGRARVRMSVRLGSEGDVFEDSIPVEVLAPTETVAAYGQAAPDARETIELPRAVVPGAGGLDVQVASTAMVGLSAGAQFLLEYPYGCAEQRASRALALVYAADLGGAFHLGGLDAAKIGAVAQQAADELREFQCPNGGFAFWKGDCYTVSPYLTSYVLHVLQQASASGYRVDPKVTGAAADYLAGSLTGTPPVNEGWWPAYTAWQAFAVRTLVAAGRNQDSNINRLYQYRDRMPVFALAHLYDAIAASRIGDARLADLTRRMANAILPDAGGSHVEELNDPYLRWFWNSNVKSTAIVLDTYVRHGLGEGVIAPMVRWLLQARRSGRWSDTQENAWALSSLVTYYRKYERETPAFDAVVRLGRSEILERRFEGRSTDAVSVTLPMSKLASAVKPGESRPLELTREGAGTLFYATRLQYARSEPSRQPMDRGLKVQRTYEKLVDGRAEPAASTFAAGDLVRVTLRLELPVERRYVAVTDPLPAGFEPVESWFATTAAALAGEQRQEDHGDSWFSWWDRGGFDHVERHDDRVQLFATRLSEGRHEFSYVVRATTAGTFVVAPVHAEEMYQPENFGRTASTTVQVRP